MNRHKELNRAAAGGVLLGMGLGGFLDGILFHQILQWHHMLSTVYPPETMDAMRLNMLWDGVFHGGVWLLTLAGLLLLWNGVRGARMALPSVRWIVGLLLLGWGLFNAVEGIVNHHIFEIHHVRGWAPDIVWDVGFVLSGGILFVVGWAVASSAQKEELPFERPRRPVPAGR